MVDRVALGAELALGWVWADGAPVFVVMWRGRRAGFYGYRGAGSDLPS